MSLYLPTIRTLYRPEQACSVPEGSLSQSPLKPARLIHHLDHHGLLEHFTLDANWRPFLVPEFAKTHTTEYVADFFSGKLPLCESNGLSWSPELADSVRYTNASLFHAIERAWARPEQITFSPTSGFHHARPEAGAGFCTFSGQVIAALKMYHAYGAVGAWIDLDGHFGNSIDDSYAFCPDLDKAIPLRNNINVEGEHGEYLDRLHVALDHIERQLCSGLIDYVCFAHGADSHEWDDLGGALTTAEWVHAGLLVYETINRASTKLGHPVPLILSLFGGYRTDDYDSVLWLHTVSLLCCLRNLCGFDDPNSATALAVFRIKPPLPRRITHELS